MVIDTKISIPLSRNPYSTKKKTAKPEDVNGVAMVFDDAIPQALLQDLQAVFCGKSTDFWAKHDYPTKGITARVPGKNAEFCFCLPQARDCDC